MNNNEMMIRVKDALNITNEEIIKIFELGELELSLEELEMMQADKFECDNTTLEAFFNGFIIFKRGKKETSDGKPSKPVLAITDKINVNNIVLKKLKIAFSLTADDMIDIFEKANYFIIKGELTPLFRKEGHKHYKKCSDKVVLKFLEGLEIMNNKKR